MALNFPNSPSDKDQSLQPNGVTYQWSAAKTRWNIVDTGSSGGQGGGGDTILPSPPADPDVGDGWWDENVGKPFIWYDDGTSQQWVERVPTGIAPIAGQVVQVVSLIDGEVNTGTNLQSIDDTIPQDTEGNAYMSQVFTPKFANSKIRIDVALMADSTGANEFVTSLFEVGVSDALAAISQFISLPGAIYQNSFSWVGDAVDIAERTYSVRAGLVSAGTTTFNGRSSSRVFGGRAASSIIITEVAQ